MSTYLDDYGVRDARRERFIKRIVSGVAVAGLLAAVLWFVFRDYREERLVQAFLEYLELGDYKSAYAMWGCTVESPCRDYSFEKFMEDWGSLGNNQGPEITPTSKRSCKAGIIQTLKAGDQDLLLWAGRDGVLGFAPWDTCHPRFVPE